MAGEMSAKVCFPSVVGIPKGTDPEQPFYIGRDALAKMGTVLLKYPLCHGRVDDWDQLEKIWEYTYEQLEVKSKNHPVLLTEPPLNPLKNREKMTEMMFETFRAPAAYIAIQAVLALYAAGRTTGVVLDIGDGVSHCVPIYEGSSVGCRVSRVDVAGRDLTEYMQRLLLRKNYNFSTSAELEWVKNIKEKVCYVKPRGEYRVKTKELKKVVELPSGEEITLLEERYKCPEALFDPTVLGREAGGIHDQLYNSVMKCDIDLRREMFGNVVLSGGTTLLPGLEARLNDELKSMVPPTMRVKAVAPPERRFSVWMGGSILADLKTFQQMWISSEEYYEIGAHIVHRKCF